MEKLAFLRGFFVSATIFGGLNWNNRCKDTIFRGKNRDSERLSNLSQGQTSDI